MVVLGLRGGALMGRRINILGEGGRYQDCRLGLKGMRELGLTLIRLCAGGTGYG